MLLAFNDPGFEIPAPWMVAEGSVGVWTAATGAVTTLIGGQPPTGRAIGLSQRSGGYAPRPDGDATSSSPRGNATNPKPRR